MLYLKFWQSHVQRIADHLRVVALAPCRYSRRVHLADTLHQRERHPQLEWAAGLAKGGSVVTSLPFTPSSDGVDVAACLFGYYGVREDAEIIIPLAQIMCHITAIVP